LRETAFKLLNGEDALFLAKAQSSQREVENCHLEDETCRGPTEKCGTEK
jgi:hypothetical protein